MSRKKDCSDAEQIWVNRILATVLTVAALGVGLTSTSALVILGGLATAFGFLMYILLLGVLWGFRFPSIGAVLGVLAGMITVWVTFRIYPNPLSMHCSFWGVFVGLSIAFLLRGLGVKDSKETLERQAEVRAWLDDIDAPSESGRAWRSRMKVITPVWYFFAIGPACILGNDAFSFCGFPSLWSWQITWWILGIVMMWALTFKAEMSTTNETQIARAEVELMNVVD